MTTTLTAQGPEDLLAAVPVVLGFRPEHSLVMLTFGARRPFHARVDLPPPGEVDVELPQLRAALLAPCLAHRVERVVLVVYGDDPVVAAALSSGLVPDFESRGVGVLAVLRAHDGWWWRVPTRRGEPVSGPAAYDDETHPFAAQAVFAGRVTHPSREALRVTVAPVPEHRDRMARLVAGLPEPSPADLERLLGVVRHWARAPADLDDEGSAAVLRAVT